MSLSVVIATLGRASLMETIKSLNDGTIVPEEILICIPIAYVNQIPGPFPSNVRIVVTPCKGQIQQRIIGFKEAVYPLVMQLDDDLILDKYCIEYLTHTILQYKKIAVGPILVNYSNNKSLYSYSKSRNYFTWLYYFLMNGASGLQQGKVLKSGLNLGIDLTSSSKFLIDVDWLAGGCILHKKDNLILHNYYPFSGTAYCEDLIHSFLLHRNRVELFICTAASCKVLPSPILDYKINQFISFVRSDFIARRFYLRLKSASLWRMYIYYFIFVMRFFLLKLIKLVN
jgi:hypothetical protein